MRFAWILQIFFMLWFHVISGTLIGGCLTSLQRCRQGILQPQLTGLLSCLTWLHFGMYCSVILSRIFVKRTIGSSVFVSWMNFSKHRFLKSFFQFPTWRERFCLELVQDFPTYLGCSHCSRSLSSCNLGMSWVI